MAIKCSKSDLASLKLDRSSRLHADDRELWRHQSESFDVRGKVLRQSCWECMLLVPLFVIFVLLLYTHMSTSSAYKIERLLQSEVLAKPFGDHSLKAKDIHDADMFWQWFDETLKYTFIRQTDVLGHELSYEERGYLAQFNQFIGGIRLEQDRGAKMPCPGLQKSTCFSKHIKDEANYGYPPCASKTHGTMRCYDKERYKDVVDVYNDEGFQLDNVTGHFEMWLDPLEDYAILHERVRYLEERHWIDKQTRRIRLEFLTRNDQYEPLLSEVVLVFDFDRAGYVSEDVVIETVPSDPYAVNQGIKVFLSGWFIIFCIAVLVHLIRLFRGFYTELRSVRQVFKYVCIKHAAEVWQLFVSCLIIALWITYVMKMGRLLSSIDNLKRPSVKFHNASDYALWQEYHHRIADIEEELKYAVTVLRVTREVSSLMFVSILLSMFEVWAGIPALAMVTRTLLLSGNRLGSVLVAAMSLLFLFAGAAMAVFGTQIKEFNNILGALQATAIIGFTGEPAVYERMSSIDALFASVWYWALMGLMFMVVVNLALGILVDAASAASEHNTIGLLQQLIMTMRPRCFTSNQNRADLEIFDEENRLELKPSAEVGHISIPIDPCSYGSEAAIPKEESRAHN